MCRWQVVAVNRCGAQPPPFVLAIAAGFVAWWFVEGNGVLATGWLAGKFGVGLLPPSHPPLPNLYQVLTCSASGHCPSHFRPRKGAGRCLLGGQAGGLVGLQASLVGGGGTLPIQYTFRPFPSNRRLAGRTGHN